MHTRAIISGRREDRLFWQSTEDFGIPLQENDEVAKKHPKVVKAIEIMKRSYPIVKVEFPTSF